MIRLVGKAAVTQISQQATQIAVQVPQISKHYMIELVVNKLLKQQ